MSRTRVFVFVLLFLAAGSLLASSMTPAHNTRADVKAYVDHAAKVVAKSGADCTTFKSADWMSGDWYVFVVGPDDKLLCSANPQLIGKPSTDIVDAKGKNVGRAITTAASRKGGGWVEYVWPRPGQTNPVAKSSYVERVKGPDGKSYIVGAGGYEVK